MSSLKTFNCPTCNAPLTTTGNESEVRCQYCGSTIIVPPEMRNKPASSVGQPIGNTPASANYMQPVTASSPGCGLIVPIIIVGVVLAVIAGVVALALIPATSVVQFVAATAAPVKAIVPEPVSVVTSFGGEGTGAGRFTEPDAFAVDGKGFVYVSDRSTGVIQRFDADGHYLSQWTVDPKAEYGPTCLTADHAGNVFACGSSDNGLLKFDGATGKLLGKLTGGNTRNFFRSSAAALLDGSVLAYEDNGDQVVKLDANGNVLSRTDKVGSHLAAHSSTFNVAIAVDGVGNSYVLETISDYIMAYKPDGTFVNRFAGKGDAPEQIQNAEAIAIDNQSRIYAIDLDAIKVFDHDGHFLTSYNLPAAANHVSALMLDFDDAGNLYVLGSDKKVYKLKISPASAG